MVVQNKFLADMSELTEELKLIGIWEERLENELTLVRILVQSERVESVLDNLESRFNHCEAFRLMLFEVTATLPILQEEDRQEDQDKENERSEEKKEKKDPQRVACAELVESLSTQALANRTFILTVVLSAIVAAIGLINDNVAVIIGAMVIAPLLGPNMALALATTLGDITLARRAIQVNIVGLSLSLLVAFIIGFFVPFDIEGPEIISRTNTSFSDVVLALAAGMAGALAVTTGVSAALVGVMVAVALMPPLVAAGLLLGAGEYVLAGWAFLLVATNIISINLAGVGTFLLQGIRVRYWWEEKRAKLMVRIAGSVWIFLLLLLTALIYIANKS